MNLLEAASEAIDAAGGTYAVAEYFDVVPSTVSQWRVRGVPANHVIDLEELCEGIVTRHEMAPAVFGSEPR